MTAKQHPWFDRIAELKTLADDANLPLTKRIWALTEIYFMYQFDVHNQAKTVRRIQDLCQ